MFDASSSAMDLFILTLTAFVAAILTFFSGFGLGTLLTPVFMVYFPPDQAIAYTGIVHFCNNLFKILLVGKHADTRVLMRFGIPAVLAAVAGSWLLLNLPNQQPLLRYECFGQWREVMPVKLLISVLLLAFASMDLIPYFGRLRFSPGMLPLGGLLSGFFGGLSGNQGALRSAFLVRADLTKEAFIGTAVVVSTFVDLTRLGIYAGGLTMGATGNQVPTVAAAVGAAVAGALLGNRLLQKVTMQWIQRVVALLLILLSLALGSGLL